MIVIIETGVQIAKIKKPLMEVENALQWPRQAMGIKSATHPLGAKKV
ncbi:hypothetical protein HZA85_02050 [Candidatus Uhrbacteria bacterium]|nr:hypothetical protein [Candidatus Uhrbacteria bacterium]